MQAPGDADAMPDPQRLLALLRDDDLDGAIAAGLMDARLDIRAAAIDDAERRLLHDARRRLATAWEARKRFRARDARLARIERERAARRATPSTAPQSKPALPAAAADALARARARASSGQP